MMAFAVPVEEKAAWKHMPLRLHFFGSHGKRQQSTRNLS